MAQEFASDNSKQSIFARLKLNNHRGFFSFLFATLSIIFILITFAAIQQQQTTQSKADTNLCTNFNCNNYIGPGFIDPLKVLKCDLHLCCSTVKQDSGNKCVNDSNGKMYCSNFNSLSGTEKKSMCDSFSTSCKWENNTCSDKTQISVGCNTNDNNVCINNGCTWDNQLGYCKPKSPTSTTPPTSSTLEEAQCKSYGLGANGEANCWAKAAQNNVNCKWEGSPSVGKCVPGTPTTGSSGTGTGGTTSITKLELGDTCSDEDGRFVNFQGTITSTDQCKVASSTLRCGSGAVPARPLAKCESTAPTTNLCATQAGPGVLYYCDAQNQRVPCDLVNNVPKGSCLKNSVVGQALPSSGSCSYGGVTGTWKTGLCPGGSDVRCCSVSTTDGGPVNPPDVGGGDGPIIPPITGCGQYTSQSTCDAVSTCEWGGNGVIAQCVDKVNTESKKDISVIMTISLQGITKGDPPGNLITDQINAIVTIVDEKNGNRYEDKIVTFSVLKENKEWGVERSWVGGAEFNQVNINHDYYILVKPEKHIQKKICTPNPTEEEKGYYNCKEGKFVFKEGSNGYYNFSNINILSGDLPISGKQDGNINSLDLATLRTLIDKADDQITSEDLKLADLDLNGKIETHDWSLMKKSLEVKYDEN